MTLNNVILNHMILLTVEQQPNTTVSLKGIMHRGILV